MPITNALAIPIYIYFFGSLDLFSFSIGRYIRTALDYACGCSTHPLIIDHLRNATNENEANGTCICNR